jgi:HEAT repeat protein
MEIVEQAITAKSFWEDLEYLMDRYGDDPGLLAAARVGMIAEFFVEMIGIDAALLMPPEQAPAALAQARQNLNDLDFESPRAELDEDKLPYYEAFADLAALVFGRMGMAMEAMFKSYVTEDYDPTGDPNALIAEALEMADQELAEAQDRISQAGAMALHGQPLWWRWEEEAHGPAAPWVRITSTLANDYTMGGKDPMGRPEQARERMQAIVARVESEEPAEEEEAEGEESIYTPVDDLIDQLIERGEAPITEEQIAVCQKNRAEAIEALIYLASDEDLQMEDAPGEGYAPIRAVQLLGELEAAEAVPTLIDLVADNDPSAIIYSTASIALEELGSIAREDVLTFLRYSQDVDAKTALAGMLDRIAEPEDEEAYRLLIDVWNESIWDYGKCLLGRALVHLGGEQATEMIRQALAAEDLDPVDHNELVAALEEAGMDAPEPRETEPLSPVHRVVQGLADPQALVDFAEARPEMKEQEPEALAYEYVERAERALLRDIAFYVTILPPETLRDRLQDFLELIETLTFDVPPETYPAWAQAAYTHLAESVGPEFRSFGIGLLLPFKTYFDQEYDPSQSPDDLIAAAREALPDKEQARRCFAEAGALALSGRPLWELWPLETQDPLSNWLIALSGMTSLLKDLDWPPIQASAQGSSQPRRGRVDEMPPQVEEILEFLFDQSGDWIHPADRPDFVRYRSALIPHLIGIVRDPTYAHDNAPGGGWAPVLAIRILGDLGAKEAADMLVWTVSMTEPAAYVHEAAIFSLTAMGRAALPAIKRYYQYGQDVFIKATLAEVLGQVGEDDPQAFPLLREVWKAADWTQNRRAVALALGDLGDRRAEPLLQQAAQDPRADALDRDYVWLALMELGVKAPPPPQTLSNRLRTAAPPSPRLLYSERDQPRRVKYTAWGEAICPDCGDLMVEDESGHFVHLGRVASTSHGLGGHEWH